MNPSLTRWGMRGMEDITVEALARWPYSDPTKESRLFPLAVNAIIYSKINVME
jgi:hypothetical protein